MYRKGVLKSFVSGKPAFVLLFAAILAVIPPRSGYAQTIGVIVTHGRAFHEEANEELMSFIKDRGPAGLNFIIQRPHADPIALANASRKLIAEDVDAIVTYGAPATLSALRQRPGIPVIYAAVYEPIALRIKAKNITGICSKFPVSSLVRYLNYSASDKKLGILYCSLEEDSIAQFKVIKRLSQKYGFSVVPLDLKKPADISVLLSSMDARALFITSSSLINSVYPTVTRIARIRKMLTASLIYRSDSYSTITFHASPTEHGREAAKRLLRLLGGASAGDIPKGCSKDVEIVFNLREAQELGIRIPMDLVTEATRLIY
jgi:putative ABC transport system substrate-binding protein